MTTRKKSSGVINNNLIFIFAFTLLAVMGVASIAPAFPQIREHFNLDAKQIAYLVVVFTAPGMILPLFTGVLADRIGRKSVLIPSVLLFGLAGFLCTFAKDFNTLLWLRFIQGLGAASLGSLNVTLIGDLFEGPQRATAMGYNASVLSFGTASYPFIGGSIAMLSWNYVFILPVLAIPLGFVAIFMFHPVKVTNKVHFGTYLTNLFHSIARKEVLGLFLLNVLVFFLIYGALITYLPLLLKERFNSNSFQNGILLSLMSITTAITSSQAGAINRRFTARRILIIGTTFYILSMLGLAWANAWWIIVFPVLLFGIGQGFFVPTVQTLLVGMASVKERAAFMSLNGVVLRVGQTVGPTVIGFAYAFGGIKWAYFGSAFVAFAMFLLVLVSIRNN